MEDGTVLFSGSKVYKETGNLRDKYPTARQVVELLYNYLKEQKKEEEQIEKTDNT
jgi:hypothetical protein